MTKRVTKRLTKREYILQWESRPWRVAKSGANFINLYGYNVAVWEHPYRPGSWTSRILREGSSGGEHENDHPSEEAAKRRVLKRLADILEDS